MMFFFSFFGKKKFCVKKKNLVKKNFLVKNIFWGIFGEKKIFGPKNYTRLESNCTRLGPNFYSTFDRVVLDFDQI